MSSKASNLHITEDLFEDCSRHISVICPNEIISNDCLALDFFWYVLNGISAQGINFLNELHHCSDCYAAAVSLMTNLYLFQLFSRRQEPHTEFRFVDHTADLLSGYPVYVQYKQVGSKVEFTIQFSVSVAARSKHI